MTDAMLPKLQGEVPIILLDSGIEEIFYKKSLSDKKWIHLLLEWANSKEIYIKHTNLIASMYGNYSRHDSSHSISILEGILAIIGRERFYRFVALCSEAHGKDFSAVKKLKKKEYAYSCNCHPAFIASLLRLGDLLDIDNNRFDMIQLEYHGDLEKISELHKKKHEAITHILYEKNKIEIIAESDDEDVCRCASEWFKYLKDEVENLIFNWAEMAPKCLGGCQLSQPDVKVFFKGTEFSVEKNHEFQINKNMLIELVIGRNLYNSKLDFIREYLQNSFDALKMKFWMELNDESNIFWLNSDYIENWEKAAEKKIITPFYFKAEAFDRLRTDIKIEWVDDNEKPVVRITISDRGIGIDEECIQSISHIGSGWDKRKKYRDYLADMPEWLRPTGGFGIGMQSGFMVSDKVIISTKCDGESRARKIILHSSVKSGKIEEYKDNKSHNGTAISVEIPYEWFLDESNFGFYDLYKENKVNDYFPN